MTQFILKRNCPLRSALYLQDKRMWYVLGLKQVEEICVPLTGLASDPALLSPCLWCTDAHNLLHSHIWLFKGLDVPVCVCVCVYVCVCMSACVRACIKVFSQQLPAISGKCALVSHTNSYKHTLLKPLVSVK